MAGAGHSSTFYTFLKGYGGYGYDDYDFEDGEPAEYPWKARWKSGVKVKCILRGMSMNCTPNCDTFKKNYPPILYRFVVTCRT